MHYYFKLFLLFMVLGISVIVLPASAETVLTADDSKFLTDLTNEGIPLLFEIPSALKTGFFQGADNAIPTVGQDKAAALDAFRTRINGYTLTDEVKTLRDQYLTAAEIYEKDLAEYSTLNNSCGSCVTRINEIYPRLIDEAKKTNKEVILFYQKSQAPVS